VVAYEVLLAIRRLIKKYVHSSYKWKTWTSIPQSIPLLSVTLWKCLLFDVNLISLSLSLAVCVYVCVYFIWDEDMVLNFALNGSSFSQSYSIWNLTWTRLKNERILSLHFCSKHLILSKVKTNYHNILFIQT
jgi:hypothetical protein